MYYKNIPNDLFRGKKKDLFLLKISVNMKI